MASESDHLDEEFANQLKRASHRGDADRVQDLLSKGVDPDSNYYSKAYRGYTPLMVTCNYNHPLTAERLLRWGARVDGSDRDGWTALHYACAINSIDCARVLLNHGSPTSIINNDGKTAVDLARRDGYTAIVRFVTNFKLPPKEPLSSYPSAKQLNQLHIQDLSTLSLHLGLTKDELECMDKHQNPTAGILMTAKRKNIDISWRHIVEGLVKIKEYKLVERICQEQGEGWTSLLICSYYGWLNCLQYLVDTIGLNLSSEVCPESCALNLACDKGHNEIAKYITSKCKKSVNDLLLHAVKCCHRSEAGFLLNECHADPNITDTENRALLSLTEDNMMVVQLLKHGAQATNVYKAHSKHIGKLSSQRPPDNPLAIFITGDGGVGKSTFLKSILTSKGLLAIFSKARPVSDVDEKTVGIIPYEIVSNKLGRVIWFDFAGQQEFYASHCAVLENAVRTSPPIIIYLADLQNSEQKAANSMARWMTLVQNQCTILEGKAHLIVVGSHADILKKKGEDPRSKERIFVPTLKKFSKLEYIAFVPMDCRYPDTDQIKAVKKLVQNSSAILRSSETITLNAHTFYIYLLDSFKDCLAVSLKHIEQQIHRDLDEVRSKQTKNLLSFIPTTLPRLVEICNQLSNKGLILYLHNEENHERSFIICDRTTLLSNITGTVFAPENFRQHCDLASSTGVVPLSKFAEQFSEYDIEMLITFMTYLELCFEIKDKEVLKFIQQCEKYTRSDSRYLFFPGLIRIETPDQLWEQDSTLSCHFGWMIECSQDIEFFDSRCLQVLILRLVFTFGLAPARKVQQHIPSLQRFCSVWKNGIFWCNDDAIESHLELSEDGKSFVLKMRSRVLKPEFLSVRSQIIAKILDTVRDFCPSITTVESVINPEQVKQQKLSSSLTLFSITDIASTVVYSKEDVKGEHRSLALSQLLEFEPYARLDQETIQCIYSEKKKDKLSNAFISHFVTQVIKSKHPQIYLAILGQAQSPDTQKSQSGSLKKELILCLETWRDKTEGTYSCLRELINKYSIFTSRNLLDMARIALSDSETSIFPEPSPENFPDIPVL